MDTHDDNTATYVLPTGETVYVDAEDADLLQVKWCRSSEKKYAYRKAPGQRSNIYLHRLVLERKIGRPLEKGEFCDHINLIGFDNRRENLRVATKSQNQQNHARPSNNKSGYKGVSWHSIGKRWIAQIRLNGKTIYLGLYDTPDEAHKAYCKAADELFGEFARYE